MADRLVAWLYDTPVAALIRGPEFRIRLEWRPEGIERWGLGSPALSVGLPIGAPTGPRDMRGLDFFENMLPEGPALERMAALAGVRPVDTYGILAAFGRDCAGAIMVLPDGDRPGGNADSGYSPMTPGDLQRVISALDVAPPGRRAGARLPPVAGRLPAQGTAGPGRRRHLAASRPGTRRLPGSSNPMARTRWPPTRPPACGSPPPAGCRCPRQSCSTSPASPSWRSSAMTGRTHQPGTSRSGCTRKTAARPPPCLPA